MRRSVTAVGCARDKSGDVVTVRGPRGFPFVAKTKALREPPTASVDTAPKATSAPVDSTATRVRRRPDAERRLAQIPPVVRAVAEKVAFRYGISLHAIVGDERVRNTVRARHEWWRLVRDTWDLSLSETARLVGGVDHTTVMSALCASTRCPPPVTHAGAPSSTRGGDVGA
jgi:Bacterial dnaA protein helix-turn-helix